jgi:hypothetical protein
MHVSRLLRRALQKMQAYLRGQLNIKGEEAMAPLKRRRRKQRPREEGEDEGDGR